MVAFFGRILALGRWNLQMSWCKCPGVPRGQPLGMAADKRIRAIKEGLIGTCSIANPQRIKVKEIITLLPYIRVV